MKILRPTHAYVAGIFFPIGLPTKGGTCQYSSKECLKNCCMLDVNYDECINVTEKEKKDIYKYFIGNPTLNVACEVAVEMGELQAKVLNWFVSGDCLDEDVDAIYEVMLLLHKADIVQTGFTRNAKLYKKVLRSRTFQSLVLTVESKSVKDTPVDYYFHENRGLWAIPDYDKKVTQLYHGRLAYTSYGGCGSSSVTHKFDGKEVEIAPNCYGCYKRKIGCFFDPKVRQ